MKVNTCESELGIGCKTEERETVWKTVAGEREELNEMKTARLETTRRGSPHADTLEADPNGKGREAD